MEIIIKDNSLNFIQKNRFWSYIGLIFLCIIYFGQLYYIITHLSNIKFEFSPVFGISFVEILLSIFITRVIYFFSIDKDCYILKEDESFIVNKIIYKSRDIKCIYITQYGNRIKEDTCNIYLKTIDSKLIPVAIRVDESIMKEVENALKNFIQINTVERKKYLLNV